MEVKIKAYTYTGAGFRGIADDLDNLPVKMTLVGNEHNITRFIRDSFSYGGSGMRIDELVKEYKKGNEPIWDGCGAVLVIKVDGKKVMDLRKDFLVNEKPKWVDLGTIKVDGKNVPHIDAIVEDVC